MNFDATALRRYTHVMAGKDRYHHGDLRNALVDAGLQILETEGIHALTLRAAAARAGVSHAAPAHHFGSLKGLLTALATVAFQRLADCLADASARADGSDPDAARLDASGRAYVRFARANPALFRLMFSGADLDWTEPSLGAAAEDAWGQLTAVVAPIARRRGAVARDTRQALELLVWSHVHGFSHLAISGQLAKPDLNQSGPPELPGIASLLLAGV